MYDWLVSQYDPAVSGTMSNTDMERMRDQASSSWFNSDPETVYQYNQWKDNYLSNSASNDYNNWLTNTYTPWQNNEAAWNQYNQAYADWDNIWGSGANAASGNTNAAWNAQQEQERQARMERARTKAQQFSRGRQMYGGMMGNTGGI
jgi:hypothetical protein